MSAKKSESIKESGSAKRGPGPYPFTVVVPDSDSGKIVICTNQGNLYAITYDPAAAQLIAAGPEIMVALKQLESYLASGFLVDGEPPAIALSWARAAIAKAEAR